MTQTVVDALEIVDVEKQHCGQKTAASGACQFSRKVFFKQQAVGEFGQGVVGRLAFQLAFEMLAFADVARYGGEKSRCTVRTAVGEHDLGTAISRPSAPLTTFSPCHAPSRSAVGNASIRIR